MVYAGFWKRFWAIILDTLFLLPLTAMLLYFEAQSFGGFDAFFEAAGNKRLFGWSDFAGLVVFFAYCVLFESSRWQATPGKRLIGIYVTDIQGNRIGFWRASLRYFAEMLLPVLSVVISLVLVLNIETTDESVMIYLVILMLGLISMYLIQYIMAGLSTRKQTLYDMMSGTLVYCGKPGVMAENINPSRSRTHEHTAILSDGHGSFGNRERWVLAGFTTTGHVIRLPFDMRDTGLSGNGIFLGRDPGQCNLVIDDSSVSRRHARLYTSGDELFIENLNSTNGITVNGAGLASNAHTSVVSGTRLVLGQVELIATR